MIIRKYFFIFSLFLMASDICLSTQTSETLSLGGFSRESPAQNRQNLDEFLLGLYKLEWDDANADQLRSQLIWMKKGHDSDLYYIIQHRYVNTVSCFFDWFIRKGLVGEALSEISPDDGDTPLHKAVKNGSVELVEIMLDAAELALSGKDILDILRITNADGKNILNCALESGNVDINRIIEQTINSFKK